MKTSHLILISFVHLMLIPLLPAAQTLVRTHPGSDSVHLSRYSYPIFTISGDQQYTGTAFFYQSGDTTYLVSNYHAIKGMSPLKKTITFISDTLFLKYPVRNSSETKVMPIDISSPVIGETEIFSIVDRIDLLKIPVELPADGDIHVINDLIHPAYLDAVPEELVIFGYPTVAADIPVFYSQQQRLDGKVNPMGFTEYDASLRINFPGSSDSARAILGGTARYYYFIRPFAAGGYSGAPVFGKFRTADNKTRHYFIGVVFAGQPLTRQTWAIKGTVAWRYLLGD